MKNFLAILDDIRAGVLQDDLLDFAAYLLRKSFWIWFAIVIFGAILIIVK